MTDKQIIIDGVDVGWCKNYNEANSKDCETLYICAENPNCYYKQLKRAEQTVEECHKYQAELEDKLTAKEQECEELKAKCKKYGEINEQETKDYAELKAERDSYIDKYFLESQKVVNLRKVLREIKEIAEPYYTLGSKDSPVAQILQKISEVEDETINN